MTGLALRISPLACPGWLPAVLLIVATAAAGPALGGAARPLFLLGAVAVGWFAWRKSPSEHLKTLLVLFCFSPLLRRLVDVSAGFDPGGLMVAAPLLAMVPPLVELRALAKPGQKPRPELWLYVIFAACVAWCAVLAVAQGDWGQAASGLLKWGAPVAYALVLSVRRVDPDDLIAAAASAFVVILPLIGAYGLYQYTDPPVWDRYWLLQARITSAGLPLPYEVRVFSTMHSPASFATFLAVGLLTVFYFRPGLVSQALLLPAVAALSLSLYRTAWMSLGAGMLFCLAFSATRVRAGVVLAAIAAAIVVTIAIDPGGALSDRFSTFGNASDDGSGQERLSEFRMLWEQPDSGVVGNGFFITDTGSAGAMPIDGMIVACWAMMGIVVGLVCLATVLTACVAAIGAARRKRNIASVGLAAIACGWIVQLPLACFVSGELGFLFWTFIALARLEARS